MYFCLFVYIKKNMQKHRGQILKRFLFFFTYIHWWCNYLCQQQKIFPVNKIMHQNYYMYISPTEVDNCGWTSLGFVLAYFWHLWTASFILYRRCVAVINVNKNNLLSFIMSFKSVMYCWQKWQKQHFRILSSVEICLIWLSDIYY